MDNKIFQEFNLLGVFVGFIVWISLVWFLAEDSECVRHNTCDSGDIVQISIINLGFLVPAFIVALFASRFTKRRK